MNNQLVIWWSSYVWWNYDHICLSSNVLQPWSLSDMACVNDVFLYFHINHLISDWKFQSFHKLIFVIDLTLWLYIHYTNSVFKQHFFSSKCATSLITSWVIHSYNIYVCLDIHNTHSFSITQFFRILTAELNTWVFVFWILLCIFLKIQICISII